MSWPSFLSIISRMTCQDDLSTPTCFGCFVPNILSRKSCHGCPHTDVPSQLPCSTYPVLAVILTPHPLFSVPANYPDCPLWLSCTDCPVRAVFPEHSCPQLFCHRCTTVMLSCSARPVRSVLLGWPIKAEFSGRYVQIDCPDCSIPVALSQVSTKKNCALAI